MNTELKTPDEWQLEITDFIIVDPDGWRNDNKSWSDKITKTEFLQRRNQCTCKRMKIDQIQTPKTDLLDKDLSHDILSMQSQGAKLSEIASHVLGNLYKELRSNERELSAMVNKNNELCIAINECNDILVLVRDYFEKEGTGKVFHLGYGNDFKKNKQFEHVFATIQPFLK